ncbi:thiamine pyrophosphokinase [Durotheca rogersii]|uniref:thiamine pyrophosphokinase n=1 Tax=Durotheca rogersii TaxID=419775 RepID=UPI00221EBE35|nr:thiamine pyrophosphokinase [Durotheca rogersii]KAI5856771.1 thiamine pyrophosphokinase [Durotheca rogersii]
MSSNGGSAVTYTEWHPIRQLLSYAGYDFALIILNQPIHDEGLFSDLWRTAKTRVAADGGANHVYDLYRKSPSTSAGAYINLNTIIGDLDSISDEARSFYAAKPACCTIIRNPDQYSTDFTKAVRYVREKFPGKDILCMGGLGGRVDQGLSQLHHLYIFQTSPTYADGKIFLLSGESLSFLLKAGGHRIHVREPGAVTTDFVRVTGDPFAKHVGIIPVGRPSVITTKGLEWDVENWPTEFGGQMSTSNHLLPETSVVEIETTTDVIFTIALKRAPDAN